MPIDELVRLAASAAFGAAVGLERELSGQRAGLRTHVLVALGACLFSLAGFSGGDSGHVDPTRIAAQVVSGIGFLGAGAILRQGNNVSGLTTAASLWVVAGIGMASAFGMYALAAEGTLITIVSLAVLRPLRSRLRGRQQGDERGVEGQPVRGRLE